MVRSMWIPLQPLRWDTGLRRPASRNATSAHPRQPLGWRCEEELCRSVASPMRLWADTRHPARVIVVLLVDRAYSMHGHNRIVTPEREPSSLTLTLGTAVPLPGDGGECKVAE
jgi:hypothetical protein